MIGEFNFFSNLKRLISCVSTFAPMCALVQGEPSALYDNFFSNYKSILQVIFRLKTGGKGAQL